ncbi:uncharacterized protein M6B38_176515 [Iris pallida]|uniref:RING-type domain-containing protein n=1 Tax=Iris pallida TaxID=29817 RepID=A0AAX6EPE2_IRIPA|nr:uncharacterized protein M6B38_176515 [Iris pallida]
MASDLESASNSFSQLDIIDKNNKKKMDDIDIDPVFEGSNCPERMRGEGGGEFDIPRYNPKKASSRKKYMHARRWNDSRNQTAGSNSASTARNDAENLRRRARLAHPINDTHDMVPRTQDGVKETETGISNGSGRSMSSFDDVVKNSSPAPHHSRHRGSRKKKGKERLRVFDGGGITLEARDEGKTVGLAGGAFASRRSQSVWQRKPEHSGYISAFASRDGNSNDGKCLDNSVNFGLCSSHVVGSMKETDSDNIAQPDAGPGIPSYYRLDAVQKNYGPRKLAQTVCVSNYNMAHDKNHEKNWVRKSGHSELSEGASAHQTPTPDSEGRHADRRGKLRLHDNFVNDNHQRKAKPHFGRVRSIVGKEVEDWGWRGTHDLTNKAPACSLQESPSVSKRGKDTYNCVPHQSSEIATGYRDHADHLNESQRWKKLMISKRKNNSVHSSYGESSSSTIEGSEASNLQSSGHFANPESTRGCDSKHHRTVFAPVMVVDEMEQTQLKCINFPEQSGRTPVDSITKVSQVESDEILARQLQEQFYHELEGFGGSEEVDADIDSLQQDDARQSASLARSSPFSHRDTSMAHLYAYYARLPQTTNRDHAPTSSRRDNYGLGMDSETRMMAEVRRSFNSAQMGRETRHNLLEALEATFDNSNDMFSENVLHTRRDFNESDYEMLLTLDENDHYHVGASVDQINSLPQSVIQSDNIQEACAICLETPSVGDVIRPLPCLHKFHKECVDTWLRRKSSCPVCKSEIII